MTPELFVPIALLLLCLALVAGLPPALTLATFLIALGSMDFLSALPTSVQIIVGVVLLQVIGILAIANWSTSVPDHLNRGRR